jgi:tripartite-type tricarboxylate transporter receptor subunit TctC
MRLRRLLAAAALLAGLPCLGAGYPDKPIRLVTPFPAGSVADIIARPLGQKLTEAWGQNVIVDNRAGAGGNLGADVVAKAAPDGYTLLLGTNGTNAINATLYTRMPYDTLRDFAPVTLIATGYLLLVVHPSLPVDSVRQLIALAKSKPGQLDYASAGSGTTPHLAGEMFKTMAGVSLVQVPYKGSPQVMVDLLAGRVGIYFANASSVLPHIKTGRLRLLASTGARREPALPDVPTVSESGIPGFEATAWFGMFAPEATPTDVVTKLSNEVVRIIALPDVKAHFDNFGLTSAGGSPEEFSAFVRREVQKWARVVKASGAKVE